MAYVEKIAPDTGDSCIFVNLPAENEDAKNHIVFRGKHAFVILNAYPYASGHLLIAPYLHTADIAELPDATLLEINQILAKAIGWLKVAFNPEGFNVGINLSKIAGAGIADHIHWHVVPRWAGDTNFMTSISGVRIIPQSLDETYKKIREAIGTSS